MNFTLSRALRHQSDKAMLTTAATAATMLANWPTSATSTPSSARLHGAEVHRRRASLGEALWGVSATNAQVSRCGTWFVCLAFHLAPA
jgi:hypothetical protein